MIADKNCVLVGATLCLVLFLGMAVSITPDGRFVYRIKGTRAWIKSASEEEVKSYYKSFSVIELCSQWQEAPDIFGDEKVIRSTLSAELMRRGLDGDYCQDQKSIIENPK